MKVLAPVFGAAVVLSSSMGCQSEVDLASHAAPTAKRALALDDVLTPPSGVSLLVLSPTADRVKVADAIESLSGTVFHMLPPRLLVAKVPAGAEQVLRDLGVASKFDQAIAPSDVGLTSPTESAFIDVFSNRYFPTDTKPERRITMRHAVRAANESFEGAEPAAAPQRMSAAAADAQLDQEKYSYVPYASGTIVVSVILPESNGVGEPSTEDWTRESVLATYQKVQTALEAISRHEPNAKLRFVLHYESAPGPNGIPGTIDHEWEFIKRFDWAGPWEDKERSLKSIYGKILGHPVENSYTAVHEYVNGLRDQYKADGAFVVYVANGDSFSAGMRAFASFNGPSTAISTQYDWSVFEHEFGHIFGAGDEYCPDQCIPPSAMYGYLGMANANATYRQGVPGGINDGMGENQPSLMMGNVANAVNVYTRGAWGWLDSDGDGLVDVRDTFPVSDLAASVEAGGVVRLAGLVTDKPAAPFFRTPFSANRIVALEYRVDGKPSADAPWFRLPLAADTRGRQAVDATLGALPPGSHSIEVRAVSSVGNVEARPRVLSVTVPGGATTNTAPHLRLVPAAAQATTGAAVALRAVAADLDADAVQLRFDTNGDGTYDTTFGAGTTATARFTSAGLKRVRVQARDARGATSEAVAEIAVLDAAAAPSARIRNVASAFHGAPSVTPTFEIDRAAGADSSAVDTRWLSERIDVSRPGVVETAFAREPRAFQPTLDTPVGLDFRAIDITAGDPELARTRIEHVISLGGDRFALAAGIQGLAIVDLTDRAKPTLLGRVALETVARRLHRVGNLVYVLGGPLTVVDVSNPASPRELKQRTTTTKRRVSELTEPLPIGVGEPTWVSHDLTWGERIDDLSFRVEIEHAVPADLSITLQVKMLGIEGLVLRAQGSRGNPGRRFYTFNVQNTPALAALRGTFAYGPMSLAITDHGAGSKGTIYASKLTLDTKFRAAPVMPEATDFGGAADGKLVVTGLGVQVLDIGSPTSVKPIRRIRGVRVANAVVSGTNALVLASSGDETKAEALLAREPQIEPNVGQMEAGRERAVEKGLYAVSLGRNGVGVARREPAQIGSALSVIAGRMYVSGQGGERGTTTVGDVTAFVDRRSYVLGTAPLFVSPDAFGDARTVRTFSIGGLLQKLDVSNPRDVKIVQEFERPQGFTMLPLGQNQLLLPDGPYSRYVRLDQLASTTSALYRVTLEARDARGSIGRDTRTVHVIPYNHAPSITSVEVVSGATQFDTFQIRVNIVDPDGQPTWDPQLYAALDVDGDGAGDELFGISAGEGMLWKRFERPGRYNLSVVVRDGFYAFSAPKTFTVDVAEWQPRACTDDASCGTNEFCRYEPAAACGASGTGMCTHVETFNCNDAPIEPVCGCNDVTYESACIAGRERVSVKQLGACPIIRCGGAAGGACPDTMYCDYAEEAPCGDDGAQGTCTPKPPYCMGFPGPRGGQSVCGCDGQTHASTCLANRTGTDVRFIGTCEGGPSCLSVGCPTGEACMFCMSGYSCLPEGSMCLQ